MQEIHDHDLVKLKRAIPSENLPQGEIGTVVMVHNFPSIAYEVEFESIVGRTMPVLTLTKEDIEPITTDELNMLLKKNQQIR